MLEHFHQQNPIDKDPPLTKIKLLGVCSKNSDDKHLEPLISDRLFFILRLVFRSERQSQSNYKIQWSFIFFVCIDRYQLCQNFYRQCDCLHNHLLIENMNTNLQPLPVDQPLPQICESAPPLGALKGGQFYHRPFEHTGYVPLPNDKQKLPENITHYTPKPSKSKIIRREDPSCEDCYRDCYQQKFAQILLYKLTNSFAPRIILLKNIKVRQLEQCQIQIRSHKFELYQCQKGTYHLTRNDRKVLMVREAFRLLTRIHGRLHLDGDLMKEIIRTQHRNIFLPSISDFVGQFPMMCPYCSQFNNLGGRQRPNVISRIWHFMQPSSQDSGWKSRSQNEGQRMQGIEASQNSHLPPSNEIQQQDEQRGKFPNWISPNIKTIQSLIEQLNGSSPTISTDLLNVNPNNCQPDTCEHDEYQPEYMVCLYVFRQNRYPLLKYNNQIGRLIHAVRAKIKDLEVRVCNQGTEHLWHRERNERILMKGEIHKILSILHNGGVTQSEASAEEGKGFFHREYHLMRYIISKEKGFYPFNLIVAMKPFLNKCVVCSKRRIWKQIKRPEIIFEEQEMTNFKLSLHQSRIKNKIQLENGISKGINYDQFMSKARAEAKELVTMRATIANNQIKLQGGINQTAPSAALEKLVEPDHPPEVQAMLQLIKLQSEELYEFLDNDLLWIMENKKKTLPDSIITDNIWVRKHSFDGMFRLMFFSTNKMREMYRRYGDCLCIDYVPMMVKRRSPTGRHFFVGFLSGFDENNRSVWFGLCFVSEDLLIYQKKMLQFFFQTVELDWQRQRQKKKSILKDNPDLKPRYPFSIITGSEQTLAYAIQLLKKQNPDKYSFTHHINWSYVLEDLKKQTVGQFDRKRILDAFSKILTVTIQSGYEKTLIELTSQMVERSLLHKFLNRGKFYCLSEFPAAFIGYAISTKRLQTFNQFIQDNMIYQGTIARFFYYIFEMEKKLIGANSFLDFKDNLQNLGTLLSSQECLKKQDSPEEQNLKIQEDVADSILQMTILPPTAVQELVWLSNILQKNIFNILAQTYIQSFKYLTIQDFNSQKAQQLQIFHPLHFNKYEICVIDSRNEQQVRLIFDLQSNCWRCQCKWLYWAGLPCSHLIRIFEHYGGSARYYISQRWIYSHPRNRKKLIVDGVSQAWNCQASAAPLSELQLNNSQIQSTRKIVSDLNEDDMDVIISQEQINEEKQKKVEEEE